MTTYKVHGTRLLLKALPADKHGTLHLPEGIQGPKAQRLQVMEVGNGVNDEHFHFEQGDIVLLVNNPVSMAGVDKTDMLLTVDRREISVTVQEVNN